MVVNCANGDSLQAAIDRESGPVTIEVRGICAENVLIARKQVTLHGLDPALDGIQGVAADPAPLGALVVFYSDDTRSRTSRSATARRQASRSSTRT